MLRLRRSRLSIRTFGLTPTRQDLRRFAAGTDSSAPLLSSLRLCVNHSMVAMQSSAMTENAAILKLLRSPPGQLGHELPGNTARSGTTAF